MAFSAKRLAASMKKNGYEAPAHTIHSDEDTDRQRAEREAQRQVLAAQESYKGYKLNQTVEPNMANAAMASYAKYKNTKGAQLANYDTLSDDVKDRLSQLTELEDTDNTGLFRKTDDGSGIFGYKLDPGWKSRELRQGLTDEFGVDNDTIDDLKEVVRTANVRDTFNKQYGDDYYENMLQKKAEDSYVRTYAEELAYATDYIDKMSDGDSDTLRKAVTEYLTLDDNANQAAAGVSAEAMSGNTGAAEQADYIRRNATKKADEIKSQYGITDSKDFDNLAQYVQELNDYDKRQQQQQDAYDKVHTGSAVKNTIGGIENSANALASNILGGVGGALEYLEWKNGGYSDKHSPLNANSQAMNFSNATSDYQGQTQQALSDWNTAAGLVYGAAMSAAESAETSAFGVLGGGSRIATNVASLTPFALNAYASAMSQNITSGKDMDEALTDALISAGIEVGTEVFSVDKFWDIAKSGSSTARNMVVDFLVSSGIEGTEEMLGDVAERIIDDVRHGDESEFNQSVQDYVGKVADDGHVIGEEEARSLAEKDWLVQFAQDGITGALSGAMGGVGATAIGLHSAKANAQEMFSGFTQQDYADLAEDIANGDVMTNGVRKRSAEKGVKTDEDGIGYGDVEDLTYGDVDETQTEDPEIRNTRAEETARKKETNAAEQSDDNDESIDYGEVEDLTKGDNAETVDTEVAKRYNYQSSQASKSADKARALAEQFSKMDTVSAKQQRELYYALNDMWSTEAEAEREKAKSDYEKAVKDLDDAVSYYKHESKVDAYEAGKGGITTDDALADVDLPEELQVKENSYTAGEIHKRMSNATTASELEAAVTDGMHSSDRNTRVQTLRNLDNLTPMLESRGISAEQIASIRMTDAEVHNAGFQGTEVSGLSNRQQQIYNLGQQNAISVRAESNKRQSSEMRKNAASIMADSERTIYEGGYQSGMNAALYDRVMKTMSAAARNGISESEAVEQVQDYLEIVGGDQEQLRANISRIYAHSAEASIADTRKEIERAIGDQNSVRRFGTGTFTDARSEDARASQTIEGVDTLSAVAKITGLDIVLVEDGTTIGHSQGSFAADNSTIYLNAGKASQIASTLYHEVGEFTSVYSPEEFQGFVKAVNKMMIKELGTAKYNEVREDYLRRYAGEKGKTDADLDKEIACDMLYQFLGNKEGMTKLIDSIDANNSAKQAKSIKQKLADWIGNLAQSLRNLFRDFKPSASQRKVADAQIAQYEELVEMLNQSIAKAVSNYQQRAESGNVGSETTSAQARNSLSEEDIKAGKGTIENYGVMDNGTLRLSEATYDDGGREFLRNWLDQAEGLTDAQKDDIMDRLEWAYHIVHDLSRAEFQYYDGWSRTNLVKDKVHGRPLITMINSDGKPIKSVAVNNGEYPLNIDFSQICKKRSTLNAVINSLVEEYGLNLPTLTESDVNTINQIIKKRGYEIACGLCFVDAKRYRVGKWAESFTGEYVSTRMVDGNETTTDASPKRKKDGWNDLVQRIRPKDKKSNVGFSYFNYATDIPNTTSDPRTMDQLSDDELDLSGLERKIGMFAVKDENGNPIRNENGKLIGISSYVQTSGKRRNPTEEVKMAWAIYNNPENRRMLSKDDIISSDGLDRIRERNPELYSLVNAHWGAGKPKLPHGATAYGNEILRSSTWGSKNNFDPQTARMVGGVRVQSFSDYEANMFFDYCQMFADMSARQLTSHAYTKETDYVRLFGMTGQKINMSIVAKAAVLTDEQKARYRKFKSQENMLKKDAELAEIYETAGFNTGRINEWASENGMSGKSVREIATAMSKAGVSIKEILLTEDETFDLDEALAIQKDPRYADNCGIIWIGISDEQIRFMLDSDDVPMIIPYHASGVSAFIKKERELFLYKDYTLFQTTKGTNGKALAPGKDFNFYESLYGVTDKHGNVVRKGTNDPKATADEYRAWCRKNGYTPKFQMFEDHPNYYKLLIDFRVYDYNGVDTARVASRRYLPQQEIHMSFPEETNQIVVDSLRRQQATMNKRDADFANRNDGVLTEIADTLGLVGGRGMRMSREAVSPDDPRINMQTADLRYNDGVRRIDISADDLNQNAKIVRERGSLGEFQFYTETVGGPSRTEKTRLVNALKAINGDNAAVFSDVAGKIEINMSAMGSLLSHSNRKTHRLFLNTIPDVINKGLIIAGDQNHKGNIGQNSVVIAAKVTMQGDSGVDEITPGDYYVAVVLKREASKTGVVTQRLSAIDISAEKIDADANVLGHFVEINESLSSYDYIDLHSILRNLNAGVNIYLSDSTSQRLSIAEVPVFRTDSDDSDLRRSIDIGDSRNMDNEDISESRDEIADILSGSSEALAGTDVNETAIRNIALEMKRKYSSSIDIDQLTDNLTRLFTYLHSGKAINYSDFVAVMQDVARPVIDAAYTSQASREDYAQFRGGVDGMTFSLTEEQRKNIEDAFGSMKVFERYYPEIHITEDGRSFADQWDALTEMSGGLIDENIDEEDMPTALVDALEALRPSLNTWEDSTQAAHDMALDIIGRYLGNYHSDGATKGVVNEFVKTAERDLKAKQKAWRAKAKADYDERLRAERAYQKEIAGNARKKAKARKEEQIARLRAKNATRISNIRERQRRKEQLKQIEKTAGTMYQYLTHPTDQNHIPADCEEMVLGIMASLDMSTPEIRQNKAGKWTVTILYNRHPNENGKNVFDKRKIVADTREEAIQQYYDALDEGVGGTGRMKWYDRMKTILDAYEKSKDGAEFDKMSGDLADFAQGLDSDLMAEYKKVLERGSRAGVATMSELSSTDLKVINNALKNVLQAVNMVNRAYSLPSVEVSGLADDVMSKADRVNGRQNHYLFADHFINFMTLTSANPHTFFHAIGADHAIDILINAQNTKAWRIKEAQEYSAEILKGIDSRTIETWDEKQSYLGGKVVATKAQIMTVYELLQRPDARQHLLEGGIKIGSISHGIFGKKTNTANKVIHLTEEEYQALIDEALTDSERDVADQLQQFLAVNCAAWGNETSMKLYGYEKFGDTRYFPMTVDKTSVNAPNAEMIGGIANTIKNMGMTKATVSGANNALVIDGVIDVYAKHISDMATYSSWTAPIQDLIRFFNYKEINMDESGPQVRRDTRSVQQAIEKMFGKGGTTYFKKLMASIQQTEQSSFEDPGPIGWAIGNAKKAATMANIRVVVQQPTAIFRAGKRIDYKYLSEGVAGFRGELESIRKDMIDSSAVYWIKQQGNIDGMITQDLKTQITGVKSTTDRITDASGWLAGMADQVTWDAMYRACIAEQIDKMGRDKVGTQEFKDAVNYKFDHLMLETQVYDGTITRTQFMRSTDMYMKNASAFMAEPMKTYNIVLSDMIDIMQSEKGSEERKKFNRAIAKTAGVLTLTAIANSTMQSLWDAVRHAGNGDDEDKNFLQRFIEAMGWDFDAETPMDQIYAVLHGNLVDNLNMLNNIPMIADGFSAIDSEIWETLGYSSYSSNDSMDSAWIGHAGEMVRAYADMFQTIMDEDKKNTTTKTGYSVFNKTARVISDLKGIPVYAAQRDIVAIYNQIGGRVFGLPMLQTSKTSDKKRTKDEVSDLIREGSGLQEIKEACDEAVLHGTEYGDIGSAITTAMKAEFIELYKSDRSAAGQMKSRIAEVKAYCSDKAGTNSNMTHDKKVEKYKKEIDKWLE